jgi:hypothetical protein
LIPKGIAFGGDPEYEGRTRSYRLLLDVLPRIDGWKPDAEPLDLNAVARSRFDAMKIRIEEPFARIAVEDWVEEPGRQLREYRFRLNNRRCALIRDARRSAPMARAW